MLKQKIMFCAAFCLLLCALSGTSLAHGTAPADAESAPHSAENVESVRDGAEYAQAALTDTQEAFSVTWTPVLDSNGREWMRFHTSTGFRGERNDNETVTITGYDGTLTDGNLEIPSGIGGYPAAAILDGAFAGNPDIVSASLPEGLIVLGASAFRNCTNLTSVNLPGTLRYASFYDNSQKASGTLLTEFLTYNGNSYMGNYTAQYVKADTGKKANALINPYKSSGVGDYTSPFAKTNLNRIQFGSASRQIPAFLCYKCVNLGSVAIPTKVTEVQQYAFYACSMLASARFDTTDRQLTSIGSNAFAGCAALESVTFSNEIFPQSLAIGSGAFSGCTALRTFCLEGDRPASFAPPRGLVSLGAMSFAYCSALTAAQLPEGLREIGDRAFGECGELESIYIPATLTNAAAPFAPISTPTPDDPNLYPVRTGCVKLDQVVFGGGISAIPATLFCKCAGLTHIEIPDTVTRIGVQAFRQCTQLASATIPDSVAALGESAFYNSGLTSIEIPDSVATYGSGVIQHCMNLESVRLSSKALDIPANMFRYCIRLRSIELPEGVAQIQSGTFQDCYLLESVSMPDSVTSIGESAFQHCDQLKTIAFSRNLTEIKKKAFQNCEALEDLAIPRGVQSIGANAFQWNVSLLHVSLPDSIEAIPAYAFANCTALTEITIPKGVKTIGEYAFHQDTALLAAELPASIRSEGIASNAFSYVNRMTIRGVAGTYVETWALENECREFVDIAIPAESIALKNRTDQFTIPRKKWIRPRFVLLPSNTTDILELVSANTDIVKVQNGNEIWGQKKGSAEVTATSTSGISYTFTVVVADVSSLRVIARPERVSYAPKEHVQLNGLQVRAVYPNGEAYLLDDKDWTATVKDNPPGTSGTAAKDFRFTRTGEYLVEISFGGLATFFDVRAHESAEDYPLWLASTAPNAEETTVSVRFTGNSGNSAQDGTLIAAAYDAQGRCLGTSVQNVTGRLLEGTFEMPLDLRGAASVSAFFVNSSGLPQCEKRVTLR